MLKTAPIALILGLGGLLITAPILAQSPPATTPPPGHQMGQHMQGQHMHGHHTHGHHGTAAPGGAPTLPGQDAFGAIAEVVRLLEADPETDWSRVDLERLRQHLIDMNEVVLRSEVKSSQVPGGLAMDITGAPRTARAIRAMVAPHAAELDRMSDWSARTAPIPSGLRLTVTARTPEDAKTVARIRGLGFIGLLVQGGHHGPHHLAMAKGEALSSHRH
ncbi:MAG TPA: hypothetical protein VLK35_01510 [Methylomirabilota bacterium]|nr:hypothetical protein [Methylomirabilota bacterium]